jgi:hypothetical protein
VIKKARVVVASDKEDYFGCARKDLAEAPRFLRTSVSPCEEEFCSALRMILKRLPVGVAIPQSQTFTDVLSHLEWLLPDVLREIHPEWNEESLDGIEPSRSLKVAEGTIEIHALCWLISDMTLTPLHLRLQIGVAEDEITWLECRCGELWENNLVRLPHETAHVRWASLGGDEDAIEWFYKVGFGERR